MKNIVFLISVVITFFAIYERIPQTIFNPDKELWFVAAESDSEDFNEMKVDYLLWRNANPLYILSGTGITTYSAAILSKNYALITAVSAKVSEHTREEYFNKYQSQYSEVEEQSLKKAMLLSEL